jgi:hypothetical protein
VLCCSWLFAVAVIAARPTSGGTWAASWTTGGQGLWDVLMVSQGCAGLAAADSACSCIACSRLAKGADTASYTTVGRVAGCGWLRLIGCSLLTSGGLTAGLLVTFGTLLGACSVRSASCSLLLCYIALQDHRGQQWAADAGALPKLATRSNSSKHRADTLQVRCRLYNMLC